MQLRVACASLRARDDWQPMVDQHDGDRLSALMRRAGIGDAALAAGTERSVQAVGKWKATGQIAREVIPGICRTLKCSADELLGLVPIQQIGEEPAPYSFRPQREMLRDAMTIVERALAQPRVQITAEGRAEITLEVYEILQQGQSAQIAERLLGGMLRALTGRDKVGAK